MKRCGHCKAELPIDQFYLNRSKADGRANYCKVCTKATNAACYDRTSWKHNPARAEARQRRKEQIQERILEYLLSHPCVDCGETDPLVLQFDHRGDKKFDISASAKLTSWERIRHEIEKCDVVCANDHQRQTAAIFGWWKVAALGRLNPSKLPTWPGYRRQHAMRYVHWMRCSAF